MFVKEIGSSQNSWYRSFRALIEKNRKRKEAKKIIVEGFKEIEMAIKADLTLDYLVIENGTTQNQLTQISIDITKLDCYSLTPELFRSLTVRQSGVSILACFSYPESNFSLNDISKKGSYIVVEGIEKPGNLGAILRTAESTGITAVIICDVKVDIYHPQVIRNSLGCSFLVKTIEAESTEVLNILKDKGLSIFTTYMEDSVSLFECDLRSNCVIVLGTEHSGVSEIWRNQGQNINIPMQGEIDSMNVSVASSIFMYESLRQRLSSSIK